MWVGIGRSNLGGFDSSLESANNRLMDVDGFYSGFFSGAGGEGFAMLTFREGLLVGADPLGVVFDGHYALNAEAKRIEGSVTVKVPPNADLVQGVKVGVAGMEYKVPFSLPANFDSEPYICIETPLGPVNVRLEKLRQWPQP